VLRLEGVLGKQPSGLVVLLLGAPHFLLRALNARLPDQHRLLLGLLAAGTVHRAHPQADLLRVSRRGEHLALGLLLVALHDGWAATAS
jgi:hypothetical protein